MSSRTSRPLIVWLRADCETPSLAAARVKLRSRYGQKGKYIVEVYLWHQ